MKKIMYFAMALLALAACTQEDLVNEPFIDASKLAFSIKVNRADAFATKGVKTDWEATDVVYLFFEDNTTNYVKMVFDGYTWKCTDKDGGSDYTGLNLSASGKKLTAVHLPYNTAEPTYSSSESEWIFNQTWAFFLKDDTGVEYTVDTGSIPATLSATINLSPLPGQVQFFCPTLIPVDDRYVLTESHVAPCTLSGVAPGGAVHTQIKAEGFPMPGIMTIVDGDAGFYFYGILQTDARGQQTNYDFQLVRVDPEKGFAIESSTKTASNKVLYKVSYGKVFDAAVQFEPVYKGRFVDLGYGGPLWATGNLSASSISNPTEAGSHYMWGHTNTYVRDDSPVEDPYEITATDPAYNQDHIWRMPTQGEFDELISQTDREWKTGWTNLGSTGGGYLLTSKKNGISIFIPAAAYYTPLDNPYGIGQYGCYWTSTKTDNRPAFLYFFVNDFSTYDYLTNFQSIANYGCSVRPVIGP